MFINIKYFIVTIAAVFFSLGMGIMIGFNLNNSEIFTQQQIKLVDDMDKKLNELRVKNDEMNNQLVEKDKSIEIYNEFVNSYYEDLIKDRLVDKNLLIIQTTGDYFFLIYHSGQLYPEQIFIPTSLLIQIILIA